MKALLITAFQADNPINAIDPDRRSIWVHPVGNEMHQVSRGYINDNIYTSTRDIGNMVAGYIAGINGISYIEARLAFDAYQSYDSTNKKIIPQIEGSYTHNAEFLGWAIGASRTPLYKNSQRFRSIYSSFGDLIKNLWQR